jgi:5-methylcytosine-specific restriction protein A
MVGPGWRQTSGRNPGSARQCSRDALLHTARAEAQGPHSMSPRASKVCSTPGCPNLSGRESHCSEHAKVWASPRTASARRTGTRHFNQVIRPKVFQRDGSMCRVMGPGCTRIATEIHHVVEVSQGGSDDLDNLISICAPCHKRITAASAGGSAAANRGGVRHGRHRHGAETVGPRRQVNAGGSTALSPGGPRPPEGGPSKPAMPQVIWLKGNG